MTISERLEDAVLIAEYVFADDFSLAKVGTKILELHSEYSHKYSSLMICTTTLLRLTPNQEHAGTMSLYGIQESHD